MLVGRNSRSKSPLLALLAGSSLIVFASPAMAQTEEARLDRIEKILQGYEQRLAQQEKKLAEQEAKLRAQQSELVALQTERDRLHDRLLTYADGGDPDLAISANHGQKRALADASGVGGAAVRSPVTIPMIAAPEGAGQTVAVAGTPKAPTEGLTEKRNRLLAYTMPDASDGTAMQPDATLADIRAGASAAAMQVAPVTGGPPQPVGEAPQTDRRVEVTALPERIGILTPKGRFVLTPSFEYVRSSSNRLVFRGVEIVPGLQLGVIEANDADRDSLVGAVGVRYGLTSRLEIEGRVPYVYRHDRVTTVAQRDETISRTIELDGQDIGDVEFSARYQINDVRPGRPIYVANFRVKPATGTGPYDVDYDEFGVATRLSTGSGFTAVEGGVNMLYPTDPAVIFASLSYLHSIPRDINKTVGGALIGRVEPGDSIGASLGFGLSLNPRFSVSFGYSHNYIFPTKTQIGSTWQESNSLQVGAILMGWSLRLTEKISLSNNFSFGVTSDAPGMQAVFSLPIKF